MSDIHPIFSRLVSRAEREHFLLQRSCAVWFTGLSGSGKSAIAIALERLLFRKGHFAQVIDGDNLRDGLNGNLGFSEEDRAENVRRAAEVARMYTHSGIICLCSFISPGAAMRAMARDIIGADDYIEVYVSTPLAVCEARDVKGLYQKARAGAIPGFTGISNPYEAPTNPHLAIDTEGCSAEEAAFRVYEYLQGRIQYLPDSP
jgi:adenylylsulfate kinase